MSGSLRLIVGPMKSGKTSAMIAELEPIINHSDTTAALVQPGKDIRDKGVRSRNGLVLPAIRTEALTFILDDLLEVDVIGIEEAHMLPPEDTAEACQTLVMGGKELIVAGLLLDYRARITPTFAALLELAPDSMEPKTAICDCCRSRNAQFSQILDNGIEVTGDLPSVVPEGDGRYEYQARCRRCFVQE